METIQATVDVAPWSPRIVNPFRNFHIQLFDLGVSPHLHVRLAPVASNKIIMISALIKQRPSNILETLYKQKK